jgi:hypothetical protein
LWFALLFSHKNMLLTSPEICSCCHQGTFCEATSSATTLIRAAGGLTEGEMLKSLVKMPYSIYPVNLFSQSVPKFQPSHPRLRGAD